MAEERTTAQKRAERNSATRGEDGHAPVLASRDPADDQPEQHAKRNSARPATSEKDNVSITDGEGLTRAELDERARRNSATFPQPDAKPVLVRQREETEDDLRTPAEVANRKAVQSSPENKSAAGRRSAK